MAFDVGTAIGYLDLDTSGFTKGFARARADMKTFSDKNATFNDKLAATGSIMKNVGSTMTKWVTLPLVGVGTAAMKVGNEFESQMSRVGAIAEEVGVTIEDLEQQALDLGASTSFSASEAALGMEQLASAGFTTEQIYAAMPGLLDLAASSGADLATASEIAASAIRGFGLEADQAGYVADVFAEAAARTNAQVEDMGQAMKYIAPVAHAMGLEIDETAAAVGLLSDAGIKGGQAGTTLRAALTRLTKPTKDATAVMKQYGMSFYDANGKMLSMEGIIGQLEQGLSGLTQQQRNQALTTLFGQEALSGMLVLMEAGPEKIAELTKSLDEAKGSAKEMADVMLDNTAGALEEFGGAIETAAINIQQILAPVVKNVVQWLTDVVNAFNSLDKETQSTIITMLGTAAAIGPILLGLGKLLPIVSKLQPLVSKLPSPFKLLGTVLKGAIHPIRSLLTAMKSIPSLITGFKTIPALIKGFISGLNPVTLIIAGIIAAVVAFKLAWDTNFGGIQEKTAEIADSLQSMFDNMITMLQSWGNFFLGLWESNWLGIQSIFTTLWNRVEVLFSLGLDILNEVFQLFSNLFTGNWSGVWQNVVNIFTGIVKGIALFFASGLEALVTLLVNIGEGLWEAAKVAFGFISDGFTQVWDSIVAWFELAKEDPVTAIEGIATSLYETGKTVISKLWDGLKEAWESVADWVSDIADWLTDILSVSADVTVNTHEGGGGSFASGLDYVPRDMIVKVHEGESIRTKQQNREDAQGSRGGGDNFYFYSPEPIDEMEAAKQMKRAKRDLAEGF